ncbi:DNA topoisomerase [Veillonella denticariosi JCM 15641]|uniref:DNA topoisomerase n=1 Tax=Veillonella denticariosi JCM 15641 TaxID=1298594 RepID=A0A2S7Z6P1_9FIRM|nr:DNA topoisomerase 3 [Veillonella denticariosi]PQL18855.1 DNA topoisomerase [Veillonella denticariosi JCM 15641]
MRLFIAEKPSMAREISKCLPENKNIQKRNGYFIQGDDVVTWVVGHVLHQAEPGDYDEKYIRWRPQDLPIVPKEWKLLITDSSRQQFETVKELIGKADIIVNAGDPDREGQLLVDEVLYFVGNTKPVQRILLNALDEKSVKAALNDLRDNKDFHNLYQSALARARADWLIGMNLSRAYTLSERYKGHKVTLPIGRVKTPTLALVVRRERELAAFKPIDYFTVKILYTHPNGIFWATWQPTDEQKGLDPDGRLINKAVADELINRLQAGPEGVVKSVTKSKKKDVQRLPLSLSSLQVLAGKAFFYDPQTVLDTAQKLYEKKLTTYPRSDCEYLPPNQYGDRIAILKNLESSGDEKLSKWASGADCNIRSRAWNEKKITAHHAIIPTTVACNVTTLSEEERNIYFLISQAYLAQFYGEHVYEQTKITVEQCKEEFVANGRVVIEEGWKGLYKRQKSKSSSDNSDEPDLTDESGAEASPKKDAVEEADHLPAVKKNDTVQYTDSTIDAKQTKPPSRFTPSTLLQAMKEIHKFVKNEDLKKQLKAVSGIGTEATRANIIDELISRGFMKTSGKKQVLSPTETGYLLVDALPDELLYPDETAVWEERLSLMSDGEDTLDSFLADQIKFLQHLIDKLGFDKQVSSGQMMPNVVRTISNQNRKRPLDNSSTDISKLPICPLCKKGHLQRKNGKFGAFLGCTNYPECRYTQPVGGNQAEQDMNIDVPEESRVYKCPRCQKGYFVKQENGGRINWVCSNRSECRTQCSDVHGVPSVYANK